jgi:hypothetical protein
MVIIYNVWIEKILSVLSENRTWVADEILEQKTFCIASRAITVDLV